MAQKLLGLDPGEKRIGVAVSDLAGVVALPLTTLERTTLKDDLAKIKSIVSTQHISRVVVGYPRGLSGYRGKQARLVDQFIAELEKELKLPVARWDERLSTAEVSRYLKTAGIRREKAKAIIDQLSAAIILQSYLDRRRAGGDAG